MRNLNTSSETFRWGGGGAPASISAVAWRRCAGATEASRPRGQAAAGQQPGRTGRRAGRRGATPGNHSGMPAAGEAASGFTPARREQPGHSPAQSPLPSPLWLSRAAAGPHSRRRKKLSTGYGTVMDCRVFHSMCADPPRGLRTPYMAFAQLRHGQPQRSTVTAPVQQRFSASAQPRPTCQTAFSLLKISQETRDSPRTATAQQGK